jgi:hypothetical protein
MCIIEDINDYSDKMDNFEQTQTCNQIMEHLSKDKDNPIVWKYKKIIAHQEPLQPNHQNNKQVVHVKVKWKYGENTYKPFSMMGKDNPNAWTLYVRKKSLVYKPGWHKYQNKVTQKKIHKHCMRFSFHRIKEVIAPRFIVFCHLTDKDNPESWKIFKDIPFKPGETLQINHDKED